MGVVDAGQFVVAGLRIDEDQPAVVAPHHPVIARRKKIINPCAFADVAGADGLIFRRREIHVGWALNRSGHFRRWKKIFMTASKMTTPAEVQKQIQASVQCRGR